jgi:hypothetical protein
MQVSDQFNFAAFFASAKEKSTVSCLSMTLGEPQSRPGRCDEKFLSLQEFKLIFSR